MAALAFLPIAAILALMLGARWAAGPAGLAGLVGPLWPLLPVMAAQGLGSAIGNIICPHTIVAGAATVGLGGRETARVLRLTMPAALLYTTLAGGLVFALIAAGASR